MAGTRSGRGVVVTLLRRVDTPVARASVAVVVAYWLLETTTRRLVALPDETLERPFLAWAFVATQPVVIAAIVVLAALPVASARVRAMVNVRWTDLDNGDRVRIVAAMLVTVIAWRIVTTDQNFWFGQWYTPDRLLLGLLAVAAVWRPAALIPFVIEARLLQESVRATPFISPGFEIDELAVQSVIILAAAAMIVGRWRSASSAASLPMLAAVIAANFFYPGRIKLRVGWLDNQLAHLPLAGHSQGWLAGSSRFAEAQSDAISAVEPALVLLTLLFELGGIVALVRRRWLIGWLFVAIGFHAAVLAALGFVFLEFVIVELCLIGLLMGRRGRDWSRPAFGLGPAAVAVVAVVLGPTLFHNPVLVWFDGPLVYRYHFDGIDADGNRFHLRPADFSPFDDVFAFSALDLGPTEPLVGAYGAATAPTIDAVLALESFADLEQLEASLAVPPRGERVDVLRRFLLSTHDVAPAPSLLRNPPLHFQTEREGRRYDGSPLVRIEGVRITTLRVGDTEHVRHEPVVVVEAIGGRVTVIWPN